jgi:hypothetical protein
MQIRTSVFLAMLISLEPSCSAAAAWSSSVVHYGALGPVSIVSNLVASNGASIPEEARLGHEAIR